VSNFRVFIGKRGCMFSGGEAKAKGGKERAKRASFSEERRALWNFWKSL
jgi:hypothetical protein